MTTNTKYIDTIGDEGAKTIIEWEKWFKENGNHNEDGFTNFNDWFTYSIMRGDLTEVIEEIEHPIASYHEVIDSNGVLKTGTIENIETIFIMKNENDFFYYCNISEMNGCGTYDEVKKMINEYINEN